MNLGKLLKKVGGKLLIGAELLIAIRDAVKGVFKKKDEDKKAG